MEVEGGQPVPGLQIVREANRKKKKKKRHSPLSERLEEARRGRMEEAQNEIRRTYWQLRNNPHHHTYELYVIWGQSRSCNAKNWCQTQDCRDDEEELQALETFTF